MLIARDAQPSMYVPRSMVDADKNARIVDLEQQHVHAMLATP